MNYLKSCGVDGLVDRIGKEFADTLGSTKKFIDFLLTHLPPPPSQRPQWGQLSWEESNLRKALRLVYEYRSQALHRGVPFPGPMCAPPYYALRRAKRDTERASNLNVRWRLASSGYPDASTHFRIHGSERNSVLVEISWHRRSWLGPPCSGRTMSCSQLAIRRRFRFCRSPRFSSNPLTCRRLREWANAPH